MPNETKGSPTGLPIPGAQYYENAPEFHVGSWSPSPAGTPPAQYIKASQVHLRFGTPPGPCSVVRLKSARVLDELIDALVLHREDVWGKRGGEQQPVQDLLKLATDTQAVLTRFLQPDGLTREQALEQLLELHDNPTTHALMKKARGG